MKCQILFSRKNKKIISKCCLLKVLPCMQDQFVGSTIKFFVRFFIQCNSIYSQHMSYFALNIQADISKQCRPDKTAPKIFWSRSTLFSILSALIRHTTRTC